MFLVQLYLRLEFSYDFSCLTTCLGSSPKCDWTQSHPHPHHHNGPPDEAAEGVDEEVDRVKSKSTTGRNRNLFLRIIFVIMIIIISLNIIIIILNIIIVILRTLKVSTVMAEMMSAISKSFPVSFISSSKSKLKTFCNLKSCFGHPGPLGLSQLSLVELREPGQLNIFQTVNHS